MNDDSKSCEQLDKFKKFIKNGAPPENVFDFPARVIYESQHGTSPFSTDVRIITGYFDGPKVQIDPNGTSGISEKDFNLNFIGRFQKYFFDKRKACLKIRGRSDKMGTYEVQIFPM